MLKLDFFILNYTVKNITQLYWAYRVDNTIQLAFMFRINDKLSINRCSKNAEGIVWSNSPSDISLKSKFHQYFFVLYGQVRFLYSFLFGLLCDPLDPIILSFLFKNTVCKFFWAVVNIDKVSDKNKFTIVVHLRLLKDTVLIIKW